MISKIITTIGILTSFLIPGNFRSIKNLEDASKTVKYEGIHEVVVGNFNQSKKTLNLTVSKFTSHEGDESTDKKYYFTADNFSNIVKVFKITKNETITNIGIYRMAIAWLKTSENNMVQKLTVQQYKAVKKTTTFSIIKEIQVTKFTSKVFVSEPMLAFKVFDAFGIIGDDNDRIKALELVAYDGVYDKLVKLFQITKNDFFKKTLLNVGFEWTTYLEIDKNNGWKPTFEKFHTLDTFTYKLPDDDEHQPIIVNHQTAIARLHSVKVTKWNWGNETFTLQFLTFEGITGTTLKPLAVTASKFGKIVELFNIYQNGYYFKELFDLIVDWTEETDLNHPIGGLHNPTLTGIKGNLPGKDDDYQVKTAKFEQLNKIMLYQFGNGALNLKINCTSEKDCYYRGKTGDDLPAFPLQVEGSLKAEIKTLYEYTGTKVYDNKILRNLNLKWVEFTVNKQKKYMVSNFSYDGSLPGEEGDIYKYVIFKTLKTAHFTYHEQILPGKDNKPVKVPLVWMKLEQDDYDTVKEGYKLPDLKKTPYFLAVGRVAKTLIDLYQIDTSKNNQDKQQDFETNFLNVRFNWVENKKQVDKEGNQYHSLTLFRPNTGDKPKDPRDHKPKISPSNFFSFVILLFGATIIPIYFYFKRKNQKG